MKVFGALLLIIMGLFITMIAIGAQLEQEEAKQPVAATAARPVAARTTRDDLKVDVDLDNTVGFVDSAMVPFKVYNNGSTGVRAFELYCFILAGSTKIGEVTKQFMKPIGPHGSYGDLIAVGYSRDLSLQQRAGDKKLGCFITDVVPE